LAIPLQLDKTSLQNARAIGQAGGTRRGKAERAALLDSHQRPGWKDNDPSPGFLTRITSGTEIRFPEK